MGKPFILGLSKAVSNSQFSTTQSLSALVGHNTGNLAFHYAIDSHLGGDLVSVPWGAPVDRIDRRDSIGVLPCANQVGQHANYGALGKKFAELQVKLVAIGLGAQSGAGSTIPDVPEGTIAWLRAIAEHAPASGPNISVRGNFTLEVLQHYGLDGFAVALGCPTLFINPSPRLGKIIAQNLVKPTRIAVTAGHQRWRHLAKIEASLAKMVSRTGGSYVGQSPVEMITLTRGEATRLDEGELAKCRDYVAPTMGLEEFAVWSRRHGNVFFDIPSWMEHYRKFDLVVGTRIHGVMLALQSGVPALCIAHDSRTLELCRTMMVPYVHAKDVQRGATEEELWERLSFDPETFDRNRMQLARRYVDFLRWNMLPVADWLEGIATADIEDRTAVECDSA